MNNVYSLDDARRKKHGIDAVTEELDKLGLPHYFLGNVSPDQIAKSLQEINEDLLLLEKQYKKALEDAKK